MRMPEEAGFVCVVIAVWMVILMAGCVSLNSDPVTKEHWTACQRYCAPGNIKEACDGWRGAGCKCTDGRLIWFDEEEFDEDN
jgi:hypothetical protein